MRMPVKSGRFCAPSAAVISVKAESGRSGSPTSAGSVRGENPPSEVNRTLSGRSSPGTPWMKALTSWAWRYGNTFQKTTA